MSYLGSTPTTQNFIAGTDQFTGNGSSTNFTLSRFVNSTNDIEVVIANVVQNPTSYSVSGNTLTISPAVANGVVFYVRYLSTTLQSIAPGQGSVGTAQIQNGSVTPDKLSTGAPTWGTSGQLGVGGANYGTSGQVLTSQGSGSAPVWGDAPSPTTANVLAATAGAAVGDVGTYAFLATSGEGGAAAGRTVAGSTLQYAGGGNDTNSGNGSVFERSGGVSGTWRQMGFQKTYQAAVKATLWLRIS